MNETDIAPLARRLAEENNVDWRSLQGSGEGGRVIERDVLEFLARVMAGDEAVNPTPEPLPDGMEAWPEEDVAAYRAGKDVPSEDDEGEGEDLFLLDEPAEGDEFEIAVSAEDPEPAVEIEVDGQAEEAEPVAQAPVEAASEDDLLVAEDAPREADAAGPRPETAAARDDEDADLLLVDDDAISFDAGDMEDLTPVARDVVEVAPAEAEGDALPDLFGHGEAPADSEAETPAVFDGVADDQMWVQDLDAGSGSLDLDVDDLAEHVVPEAPAAAPVAVPPSGDHVAAVAMATELAWVRHGQLWRRRFDDRALRSAVTEIASALSVSNESATLALLAKAARQAGMTDGSIESWSWQASAAVLRTQPTEGSFRDAIDGSVPAEEGAGVATLIVADLSQLGMDEAVLHFEAPLLALGRSAGDQAWLSLSGDDVPAAAVNALASVAELLGKPLRLLL